MMQHLLLTRFQGALIGGNIIYLSPQQIAPNQLLIDTAPTLRGGIDSLIRCGGLNIADWVKSTSNLANDPHRAIVAMLPLMLFFHEDPTKLRAAILNVSHNWSIDWETCSSAIAIGYIISRSISETFAPEEIIPQLLEEATNLHPVLFQQLGKIDRLLAQSTSLTQIAQRFPIAEDSIITPTILAIYCFLSSSEDFSIAILRSRQIKDRFQTISALTGILAGVHNSLTGIPLNGLMATQERDRWLTAAENLLNLWAGVYHADRVSNSLPASGAIGVLPPAAQSALAYALPVAAPKVIQRRGRGNS